MTNDEIEPMVPEMPRRTSTETVRTDGGRPRTRYDEHEAEAPLVPRF
ncbi:hypothetical protein [Natronomonas marina]|nr:hypothetical protein [Natronomonas marina]